MEEHRQHPRYHLRWDVALAFENGGRTQTAVGRTHDISLGGLSALVPCDVRSTGLLTVRLAPAPLHAGHESPMIDAQARLVYSILSPRDGCFRVGLAFESFTGDGRAQLRRRLDQHLPGFGLPGG